MTPPAASARIVFGRTPKRIAACSTVRISPVITVPV
jgi:hypothetical protein